MPNDENRVSVVFVFTTHSQSHRKTPAHKTEQIYLPAPSITEGLLVLVQLVMAAITTEPWDSSKSQPSKLNLTMLLCRSGAIWNPLNPCCKRKKKESKRMPLMLIIWLEISCKLPEWEVCAVTPVLALCWRFASLVKVVDKNNFHCSIFYSLFTGKTAFKAKVFGFSSCMNVFPFSMLRCFWPTCSGFLITYWKAKISQDSLATQPSLRF